MTTNDNDDILSIEQAAAFLHRPVCTLYESARLGRIPASKVGRRWLFSRTALQQHLGQQAAPTQRLHPEDIQAVADAVVNRLRAALDGSVGR